jgi:hypothetical protein
MLSDVSKTVAQLTQRRCFRHKETGYEDHSHGGIQEVLLGSFQNEVCRINI